MANTTMSPNMNLIVPTVSVDPGPDWANNINASLSILDQHNHAPGSGIQITQSGIALSPAATTYDSLTFNTSNAYALRSVRFTAQSSALALTTDIGCLYESGVDLYYNDGSGNQIRITQSGSVAGSSGTITGLPSGTASAAYAAGTFIFQSATNTPANIDGGSYVFRNVVANSKGLTLNPPNSMAADYSLVLPAIPGATNFLSIDSSGNIAAYAAVLGALTTANLSASAAIVGTQIAASTIAGSNIAASTITGSNLQTNIALPGAPSAGVGPFLLITSITSGNALAIARGTVNSDGTLRNGEGVTATSNSSTGVYVVTLGFSFSAVPSVFVCALNSGNVLATVVDSIAVNSFTVNIHTANTGSLVNSPFTYLVAGQR